ncbi:hypothetical protein NW762_008957 [Fusarium torreyae]|uniref:DUF6604 domain-containing protein n=1 Tax=Fusarium torreyae TaxID=1237075 RepID=A0A9W8VEY3_9HYPO|nr:hypothetical protein NW762_008957 [Fusarium torreyae]
MLPRPLLSAYQQYKADTDSVAAWLASSAKACGYPADLLTSSKTSTTQPKGGGRLKGKARKDAKKQKQPAQSVTLDTTPKYIIAIKDFIPLAEYIFASTKPLISVPASFAETIDRVIYMRSKFSSQMINHGVTPDKDSDVTHNYFVGVLEKVRSVLRPRMPAETPSFDSFDDLSNRFAGLNVYEPSQEFMDAPELVRPEKAQGDNDNYEVEAQKSFYDAMVAYTVMVNDLNNIRSYIEWIWSNYKDGFFDLANAAVATNTGIDLARNLMEQVLPIFEDHGGACEIAERFSLMCAMREGFTEDEALSWGPKTGNEKLYDVADKTFLNASIILRSLVNVLSPHHLPLYKEGMFGTYDPQSDRSKKNGHAKFNEDQVILAEFFTEAVTLARLVPGYPVEDEFIRGFRELDKTGKLPFYLVYATQILLDIHHIIRDDTARVLETLSTHTNAIRNDLNLHMKFHENLKIDNWPASNERALRDFEKSIAWLGQDPVFLAKQRIAQKSGRPVTESQRYRILILSPILSGLLLYHYRAGMYDLSIAIMNAWGSVTYPAHLYNALLQEGLLQGRWQDMDVVQSLLGESSFFVGSRPENKDEYLKRFLLQMGYSASAITSHKGRLLRQPRRHQDMASRSGPRGIKDGAPVSTMFIERYLRGSGQVNLSPEDVDEIISRSKFQQEGSDADHTLVMSQMDGSRDVKGKSQAKQHKKATDGGKLTPGELLKPLVLALTAETLEFSFPYLFMHRWTWKFLRRIKEVCDPVLRRLNGPTYIERENQLPFVIGYILSTFCEDPEGNGKDLMRLAANEFNGLVVQDGIGNAVLKGASKIYGLQVEFDEEDSDDSD